MSMTVLSSEPGKLIAAPPPNKRFQRTLASLAPRAVEPGAIGRVAQPTI